MPAIITLPSIDIAADIKEKMSSQPEAEKQVIVHAYILPKDLDLFIRIWPTTYLFDNDSTHKSTLIFWNNITEAPIWTRVKNHHRHNFTLIFSGLPEQCTSFDLIECIGEENCFEKRRIPRNTYDVYEVCFD